MTKLLRAVVTAVLLTGSPSGASAAPSDPPPAEPSRAYGPQDKYRLHPAYHPRTKRIRTVTVLPLQIDVVHMTAGGGEEREDWAELGRENVKNALDAALRERFGLSVKHLDPEALSPEARANLRETEALFGAVNSAILRHTYRYGQDLFPDKVNEFDYSLGREVSELDDEADALLLVQGIDRFSSGGREAIEASMAVLGLLGGVVAVPRSDFAAASLALVDARDGRILAYIFLRCGQCEDLREPAHATRLVRDLLWELPVGD